MIVLNLNDCSTGIAPYSDAIIKWNKTLISFYDNPKASIAKFKDMYPLLKNNQDYLYSYGKALNITKSHNESCIILEEAMSLCSSYNTLIELGVSYEHKKEYTKAKDCWLKAALMIPARFEPEYLLANMYFNSGDIVNAKLITQKLMKRNPKLYTPEIYHMISKIKRLDEKINSININL